MGLASCLWLVQTVPYFVMASGHNLTFSAVVMNIVRYLSVDGDRSGYAKGTISTTKLGEMSLSVTMELE